MKTYSCVKLTCKHPLLALIAMSLAVCSGRAAEFVTGNEGDIGINHVVGAGSYSSVLGGTSNVVTATNSSIAGGVSNLITDNYSFTGGGLGNTNLSEESVIGGGKFNYLNGEYSVIGGGEYNTNFAPYAAIVSGAYNLIWTNGLSTDAWAQGNGDFIGAGVGNVARGSRSSIVGGYYNQTWADKGIIGGGDHNRTDAGGDWSAILGGIGNYVTSNGVYAAIGGGSANINGSPYGFIGGGNLNAMYGDPTEFAEKGQWSTISGGYYNLLTNSMYGSIGGGLANVGTADLVTIPGGSGASATHYGQQAYASGGFGNVVGTAQTSTHVLRGTTTSSTPTELFLDGSGARMTIPSGQSWTYDILVVARSVTGGNSAGYQFLGVIENNGGTTSLLTGATKYALGKDVSAWDVNVSAENNALVIKAMGDTSTIRWVATVRTVEVVQ